MKVLEAGLTLRITRPKPVARGACGALGQVPQHLTTPDNAFGLPTMQTSSKSGSKCNSPNYKLPLRRRAVEHADASVHASDCCAAGKVRVDESLPKAPCDFSGEPPCHDAQLSSLTTPQRSRPTSVDSGASFNSVAQVQSPPGASLGAAMLTDDETEEEAELRHEQEQELARRLCAAKANVDTRACSSAAQDVADDDEAREDEARRAEQMSMLDLLKRQNLLDTLETRCDAERRFQQRSGKAMFHSQADDLCRRDPRLGVLDPAEFLTGPVSRIFCHWLKQQNSKKCTVN